ncbi:MAG: PIN domain-containing protein [Holophagales bacterium]|nr:PIN domain-containing protein [Holophagales bacterium]
MPDRFLLDSSALITLIEDEVGADRVETVMREHACAIPWLALLEVSYVTRQEQGQLEAERRLALLESLPAEVLWQADNALLRAAAGFKARFRLSFADAVIAGFAQTRKAVLLHKDPEFEALEGRVQLENLPYKFPGDRLHRR